MRSILFRREQLKHSKFEDLEAKVITVFPPERSITIKRYSMRRRQVPMCPAFSLTDFKVQKSTLTTAVVDLKGDPQPEDKIAIRNSAQHMCSYSYRDFRSSEGLHLLQRIDKEDLRFGPGLHMTICLTDGKASEP
ncbi:hypothetical protein DL98DRAFT_214029 [Cadophora sp. DSE1049]|nr:hypothetical protein DL98DRAFT_214029 [Cadophora sp. DSE1049]